MKKFAGIILSLLSLIVFVSVFSTKASADEQTTDQCGQVFTYNSLEDQSSAHISDNRVKIDFYDADDGIPSITDDTLTVTANTGYELTSVRYETEDEVETDATVSNPTTTIHLPRTSDSTHLDGADVKVQYVCVTPTPTVTQTPNPTIPTSPATAPQCSDRNTTNVPANVQITKKADKATVSFFITDGDTADIFYKEATASNWEYSVIGLKPNAAKFVFTEIGSLNPNSKYTFGVRQYFGCGGGNIVTSEPTDQQVLGASTMASTGTFANTLMKIYTILGMVLLLAGYVSFTKEKKYTSSI